MPSFMKSSREPADAGTVFRFITVLTVATGLGLFALTGCDETPSEDVDGVMDPNHTIPLEKSFPDMWVYQSEMYRTVSATIEVDPNLLENYQQQDYDWFDVDFWIIPLPDLDTVLYIDTFDDFNTNVSDWPEYLDTISGDVVPRDLIFTARVNALFADQPGEYLVGVQVEQRFSPYQINASTLDPEYLRSSAEFSLMDTITVTSNGAPFIHNVFIPDSLPSGFEEQTWGVEVIDPDWDAGDRVDRVTLEMYRDNNLVRTLQFTKIAAGDWQFEADASFTATYPTDDYDFVIAAVDRFDTVTDTALTVWMENLPPETENFVAPDTVIAPLEGSNLYIMTVEVFDPQTDLDIESVFYQVRLPGDDTWLDNPDWSFNDLGPGDDNPDSTAGDHIWTAGFSTSSDNQTFGPYGFRTIARDRTGQESEPIERTIVLIQEEGDE